MASLGVGVGVDSLRITSTTLLEVIVIRVRVREIFDRTPSFLCQRDVVRSDFTDAAIVVIEASFWLVEVVFDRADIVGDVQFH